MTPLKYAFEPFSTLQDVLSGNPIKIMPLGTFYRDERELKITPDILQQMAANFKEGLPRFRVPINENHEGVGKVGTVEDVAFLQDGADGPGLYATKYELSDVGKRLITDKRFDAVSPEVVWSLNDGAQYQDPQTGALHDNVLIGLALTDRPFFGHDNVALFSATPHREVMSDMPDDKIDQVLSLLQQLTGQAPAEHDSSEVEPERLKDYDTETRRSFAKKGWALPDGSFPIADKQDVSDAVRSVGRGTNNPKSAIKSHIMKRARALGAGDMIPETWQASDDQTTQEDIMAEDVRDTKPEVPETPATTEGFSVKPEEFKALQDKAAQFDALKTQAEEFRVKLAQVERDRDLDRMKQHAESFLALPLKADEFAVKLLDLKTASPDLFVYFDGLLKQADELIMQGDLFKQRGRLNAETTETFEAVVDQVLAEKFAGDKSHYSEAMNLARERRPDLADAYLNSPATAGRR